MPAVWQKAHLGLQVGNHPAVVSGEISRMSDRWALHVSKRKHPHHVTHQTGTYVHVYGTRYTCTEPVPGRIYGISIMIAL